MRLTNVAQMHLPFGRLLGYDVAVRPTGHRLPISFDQARHVSAGDRPGSWMAICITLPALADPDALAAAWLAVIARHGTLRSVFSHGADQQLHLTEVQVYPGQWVEHRIGPGQAVNEALREVLDEHCSPLSAPAHRLCLLQTAAQSTVILAADHSHVDMWSMLALVRDLLAALKQAEAGLTPVLDVVPAFAEHTLALRERPAAPAQIHERWAQILEASGGVMPCFPLPLGSREAHAERVEVRELLDVDEAAAFAAAARAEEVSTLSMVVAAMTAVTARLADQPLRAVFPVHSRYEQCWHDSSGWFITNSVIESADPNPAACAGAVREAVRLGSHPLEPIMAPYGGMPEAPGMFAISWLDLRRLPVRVDAVGLGAQYVGARIRTDGVMLWFILDESGLHLRCRYPDTTEARQNVGGWLDALGAELRGRARESVGGLLKLDGRRFRVQRAVRSDVPQIAALLADDEFGPLREGAELDKYERAFDAVTRDSTHYLAVVKDEAGAVVGSMQLSILPGLGRGGTTRMQIESVRIAASLRGTGIGTAMLDWAHEHGRARGATLAQLSTDAERSRALSFYRKLGYEPSHVGLKKQL